jgi:hypothetical protein
VHDEVQELAGLGCSVRYPRQPPLCAPDAQDPSAPTTHPRTLDIRCWVSGNSSLGELAYMVLASRESRLRSPLFLNWENHSPTPPKLRDQIKSVKKYSDLNYWIHIALWGKRMQWNGQREPCCRSFMVCSGCTWCYVMRIRHRNVDLRRKSQVFSTLTILLIFFILRCSWEPQLITEHVRPQDGCAIRFLRYRAGHKGRELSKESSALWRPAVILGSFVLLWPLCPLCPHL